MALRDRISGFDTWEELERAASERFNDALDLATGAEARSTAAVYLMGYFVEMWLKSAYYRVRGVEAHENVCTELRGMRDRAREIGFDWQSGSTRHNLEDLGGLLTHERRIRGLQLDPFFETSFHGHVRTIASHWSERLRYKATVASEIEVNEVFRSAEWIAINYEQLWS